MECKFCGAPAEWEGERNMIKMKACDKHFHAYYISFWKWDKLNG